MAGTKTTGSAGSDAHGSRQPKGKQRQPLTISETVCCSSFIFIILFATLSILARLPPSSFITNYISVTDPSAPSSSQQQQPIPTVTLKPSPEGVKLARRMDTIGRRTHVSAFSIPGGLSNTNYQIEANGVTYILRLAGDAGQSFKESVYTTVHLIDRDMEQQMAHIAYAAGISPELVEAKPFDGLQITRWIDNGRTLTTAAMRLPHVLPKIIDLLYSLHRIPVRHLIDLPHKPGPYSPLTRCESRLIYVRQHLDQPTKSGSATIMTLPNELDEVFEQLRIIEAALLRGTPSDRHTPLHNDVTPANIIDDGVQVTSLIHHRCSHSSILALTYVCHVQYQ
jgi:thiamine kinase-like enzyme